MAASKTSNSPPTKVEDFCSRAIGVLDRPPGTNAALATGGAGGAAKGGGGAKGEQFEPSFGREGGYSFISTINVF